MKFLMIAGFADDLLPFRGDLIDAPLKRGIQVHVALPDLEATFNAAIVSDFVKQFFHHEGHEVL
jgi:hypothetical protein